MGEFVWENPKTTKGHAGTFVWRQGPLEPVKPKKRQAPKLKGRVPEIKQVPPRNVVGEFLWDLIPGTIYTTKAGRELAKHGLTRRGEPIPAGANSKFLEAVKLGDFLVGGEFSKPIGKKIFGKAWKQYEKTVTRPSQIESDKVMELIRKRRAGLDVGMLRSEAFIRKLEKEFTPNELEAIPFIRQGIIDPSVLRKIGRDDLIPYVTNPTKHLKRGANIIGDYYDEAYGFLKQYWGDPGYIENYVTHIWDIPKNRTREALGFTTRNPFLKKRTIPSLEEGIKLGFKPKTLNIAELLRIYDSYKIRTAYNHNFAEALKELVDESGAPLILRGDKAPADWITIEHPAMDRVMMVSKVTKQVPQKHTFEIINETVEKIRTIEKTTPVADKVEQSKSKQIGKLEEIIHGALESRGMTPGEASLYLDRIKSAYAGADVAVAGEATEKVSEEVSIRMRNRVFKEIETKFPVDVPILSKTKVKAHPDIADEVKIIFDKRFVGPNIRLPYTDKRINPLTAFETINAFAKKAMLSLSFFHHFALTESAFSTGIGRRAAKMWNPYKIYRALKYGDYEIFKSMPLAEDAMNHGVSFGALEDVQRNIIEKSLKSLEKKLKGVPLLRGGARKLRKANEVWDKSLWDYYHNTLKLYAYEHNVNQSFKNLRSRLGRDLTEKEMASVKREMASFVNDSFGGQNWELSKTLGNAKIRQMLHWGLLAPDWTLSVLKQAMAPAKGMGKQILGNKLQGTALTKRAVSFWVRAVMYYNIIAQAANYRNTKKHYGKGRFTWENAPGHELNIFSGFNDDGTERYIRMGKQFRETMEWGIDPVAKLGAKMTPVVRETIRQVARHDPGSGFPTEFADKDFWNSIPERFKSVAEMPLPFSLRPYVESRPHNFMITLPASKGMTRYKTVKLFKNAIKEKDRHMIRRIYLSALQNNLNAQDLFKSAATFLKSDMTMEDKQIARKIFHEVRQLAPDLEEDLLLAYKDKNILTPNVSKQYQKIKDDWAKTQDQKSKFKIPIQK